MTKQRSLKQQEKKRLRDMRTISDMIVIYCAGHHPEEARTHKAYCGDMLCEECAYIDAYANLRTEQCTRMDTKISCDRCDVHCYTFDELQKIREVMRYAGPRMIYKHPIAAIRHMTGW